MVADRREGEADQDRHRDRHTRPVRHVPVQLARLAEGAVPRGLLAEILRLIAELRPQPAPASLFSMSLDPHNDGPELQMSARGGNINSTMAVIP